MSEKANNIVCVKCGFNDHVTNAKHCQNCGFELLNFCTNPDCESNEVPSEEYQAIPYDAKYCPYCGSESTYFGFLTDSEN
jgi:hypothetical protein